MLKVEQSYKDVTSENGRTWIEVSVLGNESQCEHLDTICPDCFEAWLEEHYVRFMDTSSNMYVLINP